MTSERPTSLGDLFRRLKRYCHTPLARIEAAYWWLTWNHSGMWSWEYEALSRLRNVYRPGLLAAGPHPQTIAYDVLCPHPQTIMGDDCECCAGTGLTWRVDA
jgi:hypothetical protein